MELDEALEEYKQYVNDAVHLSISEQEEITSAGVKVLQDQIRSLAPKSTIQHKHMIDDLSETKGTADGQHDGSSTVGWSATKNGKAFIARFNNDGTIKNPRPEGFHFVTDARRLAREDILQAQFKKYKEILNKHTGGDN